MTDYRPTWAEVSLEALSNNVKAFKDYINDECQLMGVVKADAYGHGLVPCAELMVRAGANRLGVAIMEEAMELRKAGMDVPILIFGYTPKEAVHEAVDHDLTLTVFSEEIMEEVIRAAEEKQKEVKIHIKVDSGMHRIGLKRGEDILQLLEKNSSSYVHVEGVFTHFSDADNEDPAYTEQQFHHFLSVVEEVENIHGEIPIVHCCNSAATIAFPHMHMDMVRVGISLYGLYPGEHMKKWISLHQVMSLKTKPVMIKTVYPGEPISYGRSYEPKQPIEVATVPIGYGDGLPRALSNQGHVVRNGQRAPIVGKVCMDQTMIDVSSVVKSSRDAVYTFFGDPEEGHIPLQEVADQLHTIHYEITCQIGPRVPRKYV
ncbi:alanine racemase [Halobacillus dabanensis]|uniref:Alanine racemase n=1 Tax=Halobacillus dabanensis TaxID=240302 RepID=A0A1I3WQ29_HALDA|nr:alanine racemase [Halobacillus dabanensis]SFK09774.1 alanine racemase [Halobacillus dabanensis]